jgi:hypothetical protein
MWMVVGGPLIVVVASFVTLYLAIRTPDPVYGEEASPSQSAADQGDKSSHLTPAMSARNHAATGGAVPKGPAPGTHP